MAADHDDDRMDGAVPAVSVKRKREKVEPKATESDADDQAKDELLAACALLIYDLSVQVRELETQREDLRRRIRLLRERPYLPGERLAVYDEMTTQLDAQATHIRRLTQELAMVLITGGSARAEPDR